jgi:hypothetical protein
MEFFQNFFRKRPSDSKNGRKRSLKEQNHQSRSGYHSHPQHHHQIFGVVSLPGYKGNEELEWCNQDAYLFFMTDDQGNRSEGKIENPVSVTVETTTNEGTSSSTNSITSSSSGIVTKNNMNGSHYSSTSSSRCLERTCKDHITDESTTHSIIQTTHHTISSLVVVAAVLDGHGSEGHVVSEYCRKRILTLLDKDSEHYYHHGHSSCSIRSIFEILQNELEQDEHAVAAMSGTTLTIVRIEQHRGTRIEVFNVGDSPAYLGRRKDLNGELDLIKLTIDHKPDDEVESERIRNQGGQIYSKVSSINSTNSTSATSSATSINADDIDVSSSQRDTNEDIVNYEGPLRVWYQCNMDNENKTIGLAMTRSIGDTIAHKVSKQDDYYDYFDEGTFNSTSCFGNANSFLVMSSDQTSLLIIDLLLRVVIRLA